jgi:hypothetical protein
VSTLREILRNVRLNVFILGGIWWIAYVIAVVAGVPALPLFAVAIGLGAALAVLFAFVPREAVLRRVTHRPRRTMTPDDYRHLRELETELGWEPSEMPMPEPARPTRGTGSPVACECVRHASDRAFAQGPCATCRQRARSGTLTATGPVTLSGTAALSGTGTLSAKATWDDVAYPSEAAQHFAKLAKVGLEYCLSYCPICAERLDALMRASILVPEPDLGDVRGDLKRDLRDLSDLDGAGSVPTAPMTGPGGRWRPVSELPEVRQAGDETATEGIPAGSLIENMRQELEAQRWLDRERWDGNES